MAGDKITLDEFLYLLDEPVTILTNAIERIALEKGIPVERGVIRELFEDVLEEVHAVKFIKHKGRKLSKWGKRLLKKITRLFN